MAPDDVVVVVGVFATSITSLVLIVWGISIFVNARTRRDAQRLELHTRLLERIGSTAVAPCWSLQAGIVVFAVGAAVFLTGGVGWVRVVGSNFGWMLMGIGIALIAATGASWRVARAFGLVGRLRDTTRVNPPAST